MCADSRLPVGSRTTSLDVAADHDSQAGVVMPKRLLWHAKFKIDPMHRALVYVLTNAAIGAALGMGLAAVLIFTNTGGLGRLIRDSADPVAPVLLVLVGFATLFGGAYAAAAIMLMPPDQ